MPHLIDITRPLDERLAPWPGDAPFRRESRQESVGDRVCRVSTVSLGLHLGTHLDAPAHLSGGAGPTVDQIALELLVGPARVVDARGLRCIGPELIRAQPDCPPRILLRTDSSDRPQDVHDYVWLAAEAAEALVSRACLLVGLDSPSPDPPDSPDLPAHRCLLDAGVILLEGLDLHAAPPGDYELICLPLALAGAEAAPVRAILRSVER
jgi:arylformamidase